MPDWHYPVTGSVGVWLGHGPLPAAGFHPGLVYDRLLPIPYDSPPPADRPGRLKFDSQTKGDWLFDFAERANTYYRPAGGDRPCIDLLNQWHVRRDHLWSGGAGRPFEVAPVWRWVVGMGNATPLENGLTLHRTLGVPYLPGSAVKGLARAWAEQAVAEVEAAGGEGWRDMWSLTQEEWATIEECADVLQEYAGFPAEDLVAEGLITREQLNQLGPLEAVAANPVGALRAEVAAVFGAGSGEAGEPEFGADKGAAAGSVVFHDLMPIPGGRSDVGGQLDGFRLTVDVLTPHFPRYYDQSGDRLPESVGADRAGEAGDGEFIPPLEVDDPRPVPFLVAEGGTYRGLLTARCGSAGIDARLDRVRSWCEAALTDLGAGGKTAKGYGYFEAASGDKR